MISDQHSVYFVLWSLAPVSRVICIRAEAGVRGDSSGPRKHTGPLNEKNDQLSPALLKANLHPVRFYYGRRSAQEPQDRTGPECTDHEGQTPISLTQLTAPADSWFSRVKVFLAPFFFLPLPSIYHRNYGVLLARSRWLSESLKPYISHFCTITVQCVHLKASTEGIRPAKCWAQNKLEVGEGNKKVFRR